MLVLNQHARAAQRTAKASCVTVHLQAYFVTLGKWYAEIKQQNCADRWYQVCSKAARCSLMEIDNPQSAHGVTHRLLMDNRIHPQGAHEKMTHG